MPRSPQFSPSETGLLVVGHGTRDESGQAECRAVADEVARRCPDYLVESCFLELAEPTISEGVDRLVARGARHVHVLPLLLFAAGHAKRDIPEEVAASTARHAGIRVSQAPSLECQEAVLRLSAQRFDEALQGLAYVPREETLLVLVGRGSRDAEANSNFARFARLRFERRPIGWLELAFLAMAEPRLPRVLDLVAGLNFRRIVVQPHLLFRGQLLDGLQETVADTAARCPGKEWVVAQHLGDCGFIAEALLEAAGLASRAGEDDLAFLAKCV